MPRAKHDIENDATSDPHAETGFAALEAKVEEIQVDGAVRADPLPRPADIDGPARSGETLPPATEPPAIEGQTVDLSRPVSAAWLAEPTGGPGAVLSAVQEWVEATLRFQSETVASFAKVRSPQDFFAAQIAFGGRALHLQMHALTRMTSAFPAFAGNADRIPERPPA